MANGYSTVSSNVNDNTGQLIWEQCLKRLRSAVPEAQFNTWIRPLQVVGDRSDFVLGAPNRFIRDFVEEKFGESIDACLRDASNSQIDTAAFVVQDAESPSVARGQLLNRRQQQVGMCRQFLILLPTTIWRLETKASTSRSHSHQDSNRSRKQPDCCAVTSA